MCGHTFGSSPLEKTSTYVDTHLHIFSNMVAERRSDAARLARWIADVLVLLIMEEIVEIVKVVFQERISERIREQIVDVHVPRAVEQVTEVPRPQAETEPCSVRRNRFSMFSCRKW